MPAMPVISERGVTWIGLANFMGRVERPQLTFFLRYQAVKSRSVYLILLQSLFEIALSNC